MKGPWSNVARGSVLLAAAALAGCSSQAEVKVVKGTAADRGALLFRDSKIAKTTANTYACSTCHSTESSASDDRILTGAPLAGVVDRPSYWGGQELDLLRSVNHCLYFFMLKGDAWTATDEDAEAIYAYLGSLPSPDKTAQPFSVAYVVQDQVLGDAQRGEEIYGRACDSCHGTAHSGAGAIALRAPVIPEQVLEEHPAPDYDDTARRLVFVEKVRHGGFVSYGGEMPPFSEERLSDNDLGDLLAFLGVP